MTVTPTNPPSDPAVAADERVTEALGRGATPAERGRRAPWWTVVVLGVLGATALWIGGSDAVAAKEFSSRVFGAILLVAGALLVVAGILNRTSKAAWKDWLAVGACMVAGLLSVIFLWLFVRGHGPYGWALLALAGAAAAALKIGKNAQPLDLKNGVSKPATALASFLTLGAVVGLLQFLYKDVYVPSQNLPVVTSTTKLTKGEPDGPMRALAADVQLEGANGTRVRVLDSAYVLTGVVVKHGRARAFRQQTQRVYSDPEGFNSSRRARIGRYSREGGEVLLQSGKLLPGDYTLEPQERYTTHFVVHVPRSRYDVIRLRTRVIAARSDKLKVSNQVEYPFGRRPTTDTNGGRTVFATRRIEETSLVRTLARDDRVLVTAWNVQPAERSADPDAGAPLFPQLWSYVDRHDRVAGAPRGELEQIRELSEYYGIAVVDGLYDLQL